MVPGPSPGGDGVLAAAKAGRGPDVEEGKVGTVGTARHAWGGATGGQWKVTALGSPGGRPRQQGSAGGTEGSRQGLRWLVEMVSVLLPIWR
jgi:hypothetical protein